MAALLLVLVGISCNKKPTEAGGMELNAPDDKVDVIGGDGSLTDPTQIAKYKDEFINIRLISDSGDGVAYYRAPVVVTYGNNGMGMGIFYEKRYGQGGEDDVGVDGKARVDIVYMANGRGGDNLTYHTDTKVGNDPSASTGAQYSKGSPIVFATNNKVYVIASAGTGASGGGNSELKISKGTASGDTINFGGWEDLNISLDGKTGSEAIREYAKKIDTRFDGFYTRWGRGKIDPNDSKKWVFTLWLFAGVNGRGADGKGAVLVLYSEDEGESWKFGPHYILNGNSGPYARATALSVSGDTVKVSLVPQTSNRPLGIASGKLEDCSTTPKQLSKEKESNFNDSFNNSEISGDYFINTRQRNEGKRVNGFIVNKYLTIALLNNPADDLQRSQEMIMSRLAGSGSVAVLGDGTILTVAEEAFAENVREGENRFNLVQRRFTKDYLTSHERIPEKDEYYNPNYPEDSY